MQFCRHRFSWQRFDGPVRLCPLCCAGAALCAVVLSNTPGNCFKKAAPSPPQLFLPWLSSQTQFTLSPLRCNWRKSTGVGKCSQKQANRDLPKSTVPLKKHPWPNTLGRVYPSAITASLFVRIREIKKEERKVESMQARATFACYFPLENIKGNLTVIMLEMLPVPLPFNLSSVYDTVPGV